MKANNIPLGTKLWKRYMFPANELPGYIFRIRTILSIALFLVLILAPSFASAQGTITTVAGTGTAGFSGDGGPATQAQLNSPFGVAVDSAGNLYIAEQINHRVRKVDTSGIITTVAGTGTAGSSGDGGPATAAALIDPIGVAADSAGNIYIADRSDNRVRMVDTSGFIETAAGTGRSGFGGDGGPAPEAALFFPSGVAVDSAGNLYIAESFNSRVRKVNPNFIITTVAGTGNLLFGGDGGPATQAQINSPLGVAVDSAGNLYIADTSNHRVRKVDTSGIITTVAGTGTAGFSGDGGPAPEAALSRPTGVAVDTAGNLYIADSLNDMVRKVDASGIITTVAGGGISSREGIPATQARLVAPQGVAVDSAGNLYIGDSGDHRVRKVTFAAAPPAPTTGIISGTITDASTTAAISGATVSTSTGGYSATTGSNGSYTISNVPAGTYTVTASVSGYQSASQSGVSVTAGATTTQNFSLTPLPAITLSTSFLNFSATAGGSNPANQTFTIRNSGGGTLSYTISDDAAWLTASPTSGAATTETDAITISVDISGLSAGTQTGVITVADPNAANSPQTIRVTLTISPVAPPSAQATANPTSGNAPLPVQFTGTAQASGGATIASYSWDFGDGTNSTEQNPSHIYASAGTYTATLNVTDSRGATGSATVAITVIQPQAILSVAPPSLNFSAQVGGPNPAPQNLTIANSGAGTLNWSASANVPWLILSPSSGSTLPGAPSTAAVSANISGLPAGSQSGAITVTAQGASGSPQTVQVVLQIERALTAIAISPQRITIVRPGETQLLRATGTYSDGAQEDVSSTAVWQSSAPGIAAVGSGGEVRGIAPGEATITATLGANSATATVLVNSPPRITSTPIATAIVGEEYVYDVNATDADGDALGYRLITSPSGMTINEISGLITWRPGAGQAGSHSVVVEVTDALGAGVRQEFLISAQANNPPEITSTPTTQAIAGQLYIYNAQARDPDGDQLSYSLLAGPAGMTIDAATGDISWTPGGEQTGSHAVNIQVTDGRGGADSQSFNLTVSQTSVAITGTSRVRPQAIAAGLDPILVDLTDDSFDVIAVVRPGAQAIRTVTLTQNQSQFRFGMNYSSTLPDGDQLWRATFNFPRGGFGTMTLRAVWGDQPGEFNVSVIDQAQQSHSFPDIEFANAPAIEPIVRSPATTDTTPGIKRVGPQALAAGLNPTIIDIDDDSFEIMAIVRPGAVPVRTVTLSENTGAFSLSMGLITELPNGDQLWRATFSFQRGSIPPSTLRALWGDQPDEFNVTVIDQAQQQHSFPNLEFGNNPALRQ